MIYQFLDWRIGLHRQMCVMQVETCFARLRATEHGGKLPYFLRTWEQRLIFAGESRIILPEDQVVAETMMQSEAYPTMKWLDEQYAKLLTFIREQSPALLIDPVVSPPSAPVVPPTGEVPPVPPVPPVPVPTEPAKFDKIIEGSISNVTKKDGVEPPCLTPVPPTSTRGTTSPVSRN